MSIRKSVPAICHVRLLDAAAGLRSWAAPWLVLGLAAILRLIVPLAAWRATRTLTVFYTYDTTSYLLPAAEWLRTGRFAVDSEPELFRTPGYPLLLLPGLYVQRVELVTLGLQILIGCAAVYIVWHIARLLFRRDEVAVLCSLLYALEPLAILYTSKLSSETLFTAAVLLSAYALLRYLAHPSAAWAALAGLAAAAATYIRPIGYFLPVVLGVLLLARGLRTQRRLVRAVHALLYVGIAMGLTGLWQVRNSLTTGYHGFSSADALSLYFYHGAAVLAVEQNVPFYEMQDRLGYRDPEVYLRLHPEQRGWDQARRCAYLRDEGLKMLLSDLPTYAVVHAISAARTLLDPGAVEYLRLFDAYDARPGQLGVVVDQGPARAASRLWDLFRQMPLLVASVAVLGTLLAAYYLGVAFALLSRDFWRSPGNLLVVVVAAYLWLVASGPMASERFRQPIMPLVCLLSGRGFARRFGIDDRPP